MKVRTTIKAGDVIVWGDNASDAKEVIAMKVRTSIKAGELMWGD